MLFSFIKQTKWPYAIYLPYTTERQHCTGSVANLSTVILESMLARQCNKKDPQDNNRLHPQTENPTACVSLSNLPSVTSNQNVLAQILFLSSNEGLFITEATTHCVLKAPQCIKVN